MKRTTSLVERVADSLRTELAAGTYAEDTKLPTEAELGEIYQVSRPTVRAAIRQLDALGLVSTRHGVGTFVSPRRSVETGLEALESISDSIRRIGKTPGVHFAGKSIRLVLPDEAAAMSLSVDEKIIEIRRTILADGEVVAYSYDLLPLSITDGEPNLEVLQGSLFRYARDELSIQPAYARAELHAVTSRHVAWGPDAHEHNLFLLLNQHHYTADDVLFMFSRTYFVEGRFTFQLTRYAPNFYH
jgi:GntR family transcriptional regulator